MKINNKNKLFESDSSDTWTFEPGEKIKNVKTIRVIPTDSGSYHFGGEAAGHKFKGKTFARIDPGTEFEVVDRLNSKEGLVKHPSVKKPIRVHVNKFKQGAADKYAATKATRRQGAAADKAEQASINSMTPAEKMNYYLEQMEKHKKAFLDAKAAYEAAKQENQNPLDFSFDDE